MLYIRILHKLTRKVVHYRLWPKNTAFNGNPSKLYAHKGDPNLPSVKSQLGNALGIVVLFKK